MNNRILKTCFFVLVFAGYAHGQQAKPIQFREELFDFGSVVEDAGAVEHEFVFTNTNNRPIKILSVQASCGCTTPNWSKNSILPGATGFIQASFNPKGRPGYFNKTLTITTDIDETAIVLQIKGQVVQAGSKPAAAEFQAARGNWKFKAASFNVGKVYLKDEFLVREFKFVNDGDKPTSYLERFNAPKYIRIEVKPKTIKPGEQGVVRLSYNGKLKNQYGFQTDNVEIITDDVKEPTKSFAVYATLEEYFPPLTQDEIAKAPQFTPEVKSVDFGRIPQGAPAAQVVAFTNTGKRELMIRAIQGNCTCIAASAQKNNIKPGESSTIQITFNPQDRKGAQTKAVTVYSNDPQQPAQRITFTAYVEE